MFFSISNQRTEKLLVLLLIFLLGFIFREQKKALSVEIVSLRVRSLLPQVLLGLPRHIGEYVLVVQHLGTSVGPVTKLRCSGALGTVVISLSQNVEIVLERLLFLQHSLEPGIAGPKEPEELVGVVPGDELRLVHEEHGLHVPLQQSLERTAIFTGGHREEGVHV